jgi:hypothetical protein
MEDFPEVEYDHPNRAKSAVKRWRLAHADILPKPLRGGRITFGSRDWMQECGGKIAHATLDTALQHVSELQLKPKIHATNGSWLTIYSCRWCEWFHVGHSTLKLEQEGSVVWSERSR